MFYVRSASSSYCVRLNQWILIWGRSGTSIEYTQIPSEHQSSKLCRCRSPVMIRWGIE